jgi:endo-1,4-beta-xylanase
MKKLLITALFLFAILTAYSCSDDDDNVVGGDKELPTLDIDNLRQSPFKMGAAVNITALQNDADYRNLLIKEVSSVTAENAMKMSAMSVSKGVYDFTDADYMVNFAQENNMRVHGHVLIWHQSLPSWVVTFTGDKEEWKAMMKQYIQDVMSHFKGKVSSWDVVNEALLDDGTMRPTIWLEKIGAEYIQLAFEYAHEADPSAILFYNEYGQEYSHTKQVAINKLVDDLLEKGVPVHGIGLQMHTNIFADETRLKYAVRTAAARNLKVHISELDVAVNPEEDETLKFTDELAKQQQAIYRYATQAMMEVPADNQFGITFWGITDKYSWLTEKHDWGLPFDENFKAKPAYTGILQGLYK